MNFGEFGIGFKGAMLAFDILDKKTTMFEDLVKLIDRKLNPMQGLGSEISANEIFDLYQKYSDLEDPNGTYRDTLSVQNGDGRDWLQSERIFTRMSDLMNNTYKYKHSAESFRWPAQMISPCRNSCICWATI